MILTLCNIYVLRNLYYVFHSGKITGLATRKLALLYQCYYWQALSKTFNLSDSQLPNKNEEIDWLTSKGSFWNQIKICNGCGRNHVHLSFGDQGRTTYYCHPPPVGRGVVRGKKQTQKCIISGLQNFNVCERLSSTSRTLETYRIQKGGA